MPLGLSARPPKEELNKENHLESPHQSHFMNQDLCCNQLAERAP